MYNVPIISFIPVYLREYLSTFPYLNNSIAIKINDEVQLYNLLFDLENINERLKSWKKSRDKFINLHASGFDGKACERIYNNLIVNMI